MNKIFLMVSVFLILNLQNLSASECVEKVVVKEGSVSYVAKLEWLIRIRHIPNLSCLL